MISYETAKKLKKAGFPQRGLPTYCSQCKKAQFNDEGIDGCSCFLDPKTKEPKKVFPENFFIPTLSELIEACGVDFEVLARVPDGQLVDMDTGQSIGPMWKAYPTDEAYYEKMDGDCVKDCCGECIADNPEEAVAKLWLELQMINK